MKSKAPTVFWVDECTLIVSVRSRHLAGHGKLRAMEGGAYHGPAFDFRETASLARSHLSLAAIETQRPGVLSASSAE